MKKKTEESVSKDSFHNIGFQGVVNRTHDDDRCRFVLSTMGRNLESSPPNNFML